MGHPRAEAYNTILYCPSGTCLASLWFNGPLRFALRHWCIHKHPAIHLLQSNYHSHWFHQSSHYVHLTLSWHEQPYYIYTTLLVWHAPYTKHVRMCACIEAFKYLVQANSTTYKNQPNVEPFPPKSFSLNSVFLWRRSALNTKNGPSINLPIITLPSSHCTFVKRSSSELQGTNNTSPVACSNLLKEISSNLWFEVHLDPNHSLRQKLVHGQQDT